MKISGWRYCLVALLASAALLVSVAEAAGLAVAVQRVDSAEFPKVRIFVTVATDEGTTITNLDAQAFQLLEDGKPITGFQVDSVIDSQEPVAVSLNVDLSGSMDEGGKMDAAKQAATAFIDTIGPKDTVSIASFADGVQVVQGYTGNKDALKNAVSKLSAKGETSLYDAIHQSAQLIGALPIQRKVIIVLTDGEDTKSKQSLDASIAAAKTAGATVLAVGLGQDVKKDVLSKIASDTGGAAFYVSPEDLKQLFLSFSDRLRRQYVLIYNSKLPADEKPHSVVVQVQDRGRTGEAKGPLVAKRPPLVLEVKGIANAGEVSGTQAIQVGVSGGTARQVELLVDDQPRGVATATPIRIKLRQNMTKGSNCGIV